MKKKRSFASSAEFTPLDTPSHTNHQVKHSHTHTMSHSSSPQHPFHKLTPDTISLIFQYHLHIEKCDSALPSHDASTWSFLRTHIRSISLSPAINVASYLKQVIYFPKKRLFHLDIASNYNLTSEGFTYMRGIESLNMSRARVRDYTDEIFTNLRGIRHLDISFLTGVSDAAFLNLRGIESLDMTHVHDITDEGIKNLRGTIRRLNMEGCINITDAAFPNLRTLVSLNITGCKQLTDKAFENLRELRTLRMNDVSQETVSDKALENLRQVTRLSMQYCRQKSITDQGICNLIHATSLDISHCTQITDLAFQSFRTLKHLRMTGCRQITDAAFPNLRRLEALEMDGLDKVSADGFKNLRGIRIVSADHCPQLDAESLRQLRGVQHFSWSSVKISTLHDEDFHNLTSVKSLAVVDGPDALTKRMLWYLDGIEQLFLTNTLGIRVEEKDLDWVKLRLRRVRRLHVSETFGSDAVLKDVSEFVRGLGGEYFESHV